MTTAALPSIGTAPTPYYREAAEGEARGLVRYAEEQNVSADIIGEDAAVVIEASETHTRTGFIDVRVPEGGQKNSQTIRIPVTHVEVFGWYDNEMGHLPPGRAHELLGQ